MKTVATLALLALSSVTIAAPLCRDSKGLFTPCPAGTAHATPHRAKASGPTASAEDPAATPTARPDRPAKPPVVARAKLCRDGKGLFTPCPR